MSIARFESALPGHFNGVGIGEVNAQPGIRLAAGARRHTLNLELE